QPSAQTGRFGARAQRQGAARTREPREVLLAELERAGVVFGRQNPRSEVVGVARAARGGGVVWLAKGDRAAGLDHIMRRHADEFAEIGVVGRAAVAALVMGALEPRTPVDHRGQAGQVFAVAVAGRIQRVTVVVAANGFVVTAYPTWN